MMYRQDRREPERSDTTARSWSRREALAPMIGFVALPAVGRLASRTGVAATGLRDRADLPPRTVGLRSLGGAFRFDPPGLRIAPGETVTWLNIGDFHTVTAFHPDNAHLFPGEIPTRIPDGAPSFHSGMLGLDAGSRFEHRFERPGVYDYFCQPHYHFGMVGRVVVGERADADPAPASQLAETARDELPAIDEIYGRRGPAFEWGSRINGVLLLRVDGGEAIGSRVEALRHALARAAADGLLSDSADAARFRDTLDRFVALAVEGDYERLVETGDELKNALDRDG